MDDEPSQPLGDPARHLPAVLAAVVVVVLVAAAFWFQLRYAGLEQETRELAESGATVPSGTDTTDPTFPTDPTGPTDPTDPTGPTEPTGGNEPAALITLTDDGQDVRADADDITVPNGSTVEVALTATLVCDLGPPENLFEVVAGDPTLSPGTTVTLRTPEEETAVKLACTGLDDQHTLAVRSGPGGSADDPASATLTFDGTAVDPQPSELSTLPESELSIGFELAEVCELGATSGPFPEVAGEDAVIGVGEQVRLRLGSDVTYRLACLNLARAQEFIIRAAA